jgi:NNP family nitrate/nitrite transporter-like MFS transporter
MAPVVSTVARLPAPSKTAQYQALMLSALAFPVWTLFAIVGVKIKQELSLNDSEFGLVVATPILTGALSRVFLGLLSDRFGDRRVFALLMLLTAGAVYSVSIVSSFALFLVAALGLGFSGGSFAVGVSYVSNWFDRGHQGTAAPGPVCQLQGISMSGLVVATSQLNPWLQSRGLFSTLAGSAGRHALS